MVVSLYPFVVDKVHMYTDYVCNVVFRYLASKQDKESKVLLSMAEEVPYFYCSTHITVKVDY